MQRSLTVLLIAAAAAHAPTGASAVSVDRFLMCKAVTDDKFRLACFDAAAKDAGASADSSNSEVQSEAPPNPGEWRVSSDTSPIAGTSDVFLSLTGTPVRGKFGREITPALFIRCAENKTSVYIDWSQYLGLDETRVEWRIDDQGPKNSAWRLSTDNEATGLWSGAPAIAFAKSLVGKTTLAVRVVPYSESPVVSIFQVSGLDAVLPKVAAACKWKA